MYYIEVHLLADYIQQSYENYTTYCFILGRAVA
jgi:hypothetical protein